MPNIQPPHAFANLIDDPGVSAIHEFARNGGTVIMSFFSGVVDSCNRVRPDGYPGAFRELIGAKIDEYWPARPGETFTVEFTDGRVTTSTWWREDLHLESGKPLAVYQDGLLAGRAAVVENGLGSGRVVYFATLLEESAFGEVLVDAVRDAGVESAFAGVPSHVECTIRGDKYLFLLNHSADEPATVPLPFPGTDLLTGEQVAETIALPPLSAAVIEVDLHQ